MKIAELYINIIHYIYNIYNIIYKYIVLEKSNEIEPDLGSEKNRYSGANTEIWLKIV